MPPDDFGERTEAPTQRRRDESRRQGQVARSVDLSSAVILLGALGALHLLGPRMYGQMAGLMARLLGPGDPSAFEPSRMDELIRQCLWGVAMVLAPLMLTVMVMAMVANVMQVGFMVTGEPLVPKFSKISPLAGLKRLMSMRSLIRLAMSLGKVIVIGAVAYLSIVARLGEILRSADLGPASMVAAGGHLVFMVVIRIAVVLLVLAILDYLYQRWQHEQDLRMTRQEVKEDLKHMEGDPQIRARRQRIARQLAMQRMSTEVPGSTVVVTNPTHLSVALLYEEGMNAPKVVAKGADHLAIRIRQIAAAGGVPIVERRPLAQALYKQCRVGDEIPVGLYQAVAEVLAYVYELSRIKRIGRRIPAGVAE
ncbi:MAG: flagellar biosynthesis protein FlhB [Planctomycetes bacterium]|nr:flagellar biosynthesis protein FlhB [Planctomycetota bacterium]